uniref:Protein root UVB sensitive/RUS domain-containing protein n=1 Tax=Oryza glumipatula TaxID=40148 RepID=A0A0D9Y324_9ORYZ
MAELPDEEDRGYAPASRPRRHPVEEEETAASPSGRFGTLFDDDPKKWRMYADFIGSAGSIFELITPLYPGYFLPLASLGNLAKAVGRGFRDPSFRVIQNHFAESGNLGEVAAKDTSGGCNEHVSPQEPMASALA